MRRIRALCLALPLSTLAVVMLRDTSPEHSIGDLDFPESLPLYLPNTRQNTVVWAPKGCLMAGGYVCM